MNRTEFFLLILLVFPFFNISADEVSFYKDDIALIHHIKSSDYVFTKVLGQCKSEKLKRNGKKFEYSAVCSSKEYEDAEGGGCPEYKVTANGTVDVAHWATVREFYLKLLCYS